MIVSFADTDTEALAREAVCHRRWCAFEAQAIRRLDMIDAAASVGDLRSPPGNRLEKLSGRRAGQWSIRINGGSVSAGTIPARKVSRSSITTEAPCNAPYSYPSRRNSHRGIPGSFRLSANALAHALGVPANRVSDIIRQRRGVTADTAFRLGRYFSTSPEFWMNLQVAHDLSKAEAEHDYSGVCQRELAEA